jgi:hypothetical protein
MDGHTIAAAWLFGTESTDRALHGWRPRVYIALGGNAMFAKEWAGLARWAPVRYAWAWFEAVTGTHLPACDRPDAVTVRDTTGGTP